MPIYFSLDDVQYKINLQIAAITKRFYLYSISISS